MPKKKDKIIHLSKFAQGRETPEEMHRRVGWGGKKCACGMTAGIRILAFAPLAEMMERDPWRVHDLAERNEGRLPVVELKYGRFIRLGETWACDMCRPAAERAAAKLPSWVHTEIQTGPGPDKPFSQVPGA